MNPKDDKFSQGGAEAARDNRETSISSNKPRNCDSDSTGMKRAAAKKLIERYYYQLTDGCGNPQCDNVYCASSGKVSLTRNEAAARAISLFAEKAQLCEPNPPKIAKLPSSVSATSSVASSSELDAVPKTSTTPSCDGSMINIPSTSGAGDPHKMLDPRSMSKEKLKESYLTESKLLEVISSCNEGTNYALLIRTLGQIFSKAECLNRSFLKEKLSPETAENMSKEAIRAMEEDQDKDLDSKEVEETSPGDMVTDCTAAKTPVKPDEVTVDIDSVRRCYKALYAIPGLAFQPALLNALLMLSESAEFELRYHGPYEKDPNYLNMFVIVMEIPALHSMEFTELALPAICKAIVNLPNPAQAKLARVWSKFGRERIKEIVDTLHQLITERVIKAHVAHDFCINDDDAVTSATKVMKILFYASIFGGKLDHESTIVEESETSETDENLQDLLQGAVGRESKEPKQQKEDPLAQELGVRVIDCRKPLVPFEDFYNEPLSDQIEMHKDFGYYRDIENKFSFMNYGFILTPATRAVGLYYDNRIRMYNERRMSFLHSVVHGAPPNPYLKLKVRRDHIIDDALVELEMVAMENPNDLKKQLVVEFEGEQGIDEGGVSKEFFQLVVEEIFNPDFAMFTLNPETQTYWFNPTSFESDAQFTLIGIVLGLAIYNNVILDIHFPPVVYRKLLGKKGTFEDLQEWDPSLSQGMKELLQYTDADVDEVFGLTFRIGYKDIFGTHLTYDLKENGDKVNVVQENKNEFVDLYADFLLNKSVKKQFGAFRRGFQMVTEESPLKTLFTPEDVELLVCGNTKFDFNALEEATEYDNGYTSETPIIRNFWEIVHELSIEQKRKLLQFTTGSDRVPIGGLSKLKLMISRNGPDSERLPTAHTCFNVLLLPEYSSKEKLRERLLKAITYSKGFGML